VISNFNLDDWTRHAQVKHQIGKLSM